MSEASRTEVPEGRIRIEHSIESADAARGEGAPEVCVVAPVGDLDAGTAHSLESLCVQLLGEGHHRFVVDLTGVPFVDSSGMSVMVHLYKRVRVGHGDVRISGVSPTVMKVFSLIRLDRVFDMFETTSDAVASYGDPT